MNIVYTYQVKIHCSCHKQPDIRLDGANISFNLKDGKLESLFISFSDVSIKGFEDDFKGKELEYTKKAFKIATYVSNRVFIQCGVDVCEEPMSIFDVSPTYEPETEEEGAKWSNLKKMAFSSILSTICVVGEIDTKQYDKGYNYSLLYSYYADAMRVQNPFLKYRLFFDVLQKCYDSQRGENFDRQIENDIKNINNKYKQDFVRELREIRNKIEHHNRGDNLNKENFDSIVEVNKHMEDLQKLALDVIKFKEEQELKVN